MDFDKHMIHSTWTICLKNKCETHSFGFKCMHFSRHAIITSMLLKNHSSIPMNLQEYEFLIFLFLNGIIIIEYFVQCCKGYFKLILRMLWHVIQKSGPNVSHFYRDFHTFRNLEYFSGELCDKTLLQDADTNCCNI